MSDQCNTWSDTTAECTSCYPGWTLKDGACVIEGGNGGEQPTGECNFREVLIDGNCVAVSDQCNTWSDTTAECTSCYPGWTLRDGACVIEGGNGGEQPTGECGFRQVLVDGNCVDVSDQCNTWSDTTAECTSCYPGWTLRDGACVVEGGNGGEEPTNGNGNNGECDFRQVLIDGECVTVSDQCNTWSDTTAECTSCYPGWTLRDGACVV